MYWRSKVTFPWPDFSRPYVYHTRHDLPEWWEEFKQRHPKPREWRAVDTQEYMDCAAERVLGIATEMLQQRMRPFFRQQIMINDISGRLYARRREYRYHGGPEQKASRMRQCQATKRVREMDDLFHRRVIAAYQRRQAKRRRWRTVRAVLHHGWWAICLLGLVIIFWGNPNGATMNGWGFLGLMVFFFGFGCLDVLSDDDEESPPKIPEIPTRFQALDQSAIHPSE